MGILGFTLAGVVGLLLGVLGGGGSILLVPMLVYALGVPPKEAVVISLPIVGLTSMAGAISHWMAGTVQARSAAAFGLVAMAGAFAGARLSVLLPAVAQLGVLAVVMLAAGVTMLATRSPDAAVPSAGAAGGQRAWLAVGAALAIGMLTGLIGIGGGFLFVPALVLFAKVPMHAAVGTSLVVIALNAAAGVAGYIGTIAVPWHFVLAFAATASVGAVAGSRLAHRLPARTLRRAFAILLLLTAGFVLADVLF